MPDPKDLSKPVVGNERQTAYEVLKQAILNGELRSGDPLVETSLANWLSVSRTPIREALNRLEQDGLAQRGRRGLFVRERSPEELLDIYDTRCVLEAMASEVAAERRTEHDLRVLDHLLDVANTVDPSDRRAMAEHNHEFHTAIWRASRNETVLDLLQRLDLHLHRYPETTLAYPGRWDESRNQHRELVEAIRRRDPKEAGRVASGHFNDARDIRLKLAYEDLSIR
jgi:DNA-binding GntR family transcriptional regulator